MNPIVGGLITGGASLAGSIFSADQSAKNTQAQIAASEQMQASQNQFSELMSNTAYQRASADMKQAGLNPMMMFGSGGAASSPQASQAQAPMPQTRSAFEGVGNAASQAVSTAIAAKTFDRMTQEIANMQAQQSLTQAQDITERVRPTVEAERAGVLRRESETMGARLPAAQLEGTSAKDVLALPAWLRQSLNVGAWGGNKLDATLSPATDVFNTLTNSALRRRGMAIMQERHDIEHGLDR